MDDEQKVFQESPMDVYQVRMTAWHSRMARWLGDGVMAQGIRRAIEVAVKKKQEDEKK